MKKSSSTQGQETRERIVQAARKLFHEKGYTAVGVADLCAEAGVVKGSFYHFFPGKSDLLVEVTRRNWSMTRDALAHLLDSPGPGRERIRTFMEMIVATARRMKKEDGFIYGCNIGVLASELGAASPAVLGEIFQQWHAALVQLVEAGKSDGSIAPTVDARTAASALLASIQGMSTLGRTFNDPAMLESIAGSALAQVPAP